MAIGRSVGTAAVATNVPPAGQLSARAPEQQSSRVAEHATRRHDQGELYNYFTLAARQSTPMHCNVFKKASFAHSVMCKSGLKCAWRSPISKVRPSIWALPK